MHCIISRYEAHGKFRENSDKVARRSPISRNSTREPCKFASSRASLWSWGWRSLISLSLRGIWIPPPIPLWLPFDMSCQMSANISANFASTFWSARAPRRAWSKATVCSKNSTFAYFDGDAWALRLRSSTPISSYASDSKLVPVSTYTVTTSWLCHRLLALQRAVSFRLSFSFSRPFLL